MQNYTWYDSVFENPRHERMTGYFFAMAGKLQVFEFFYERRNVLYL